MISEYLFLQCPCHSVLFKNPTCLKSYWTKSCILKRGDIFLKGANMVLGDQIFLDMTLVVSLQNLNEHNKFSPLIFNFLV